MATATATASQTATATNTVTSVNLAAAWALDESSGTSAADASGNGNTLALTSPSVTAGQCALAVSYNGTTTMGNAGTGPSIADLSPLTVSLWVKRSGLGALVYKSDNNGSAGWWLQFTGGTLEFAVVRSSSNYRVTAALPSADVWHHVAATWTGQFDTSGAAQLYLDGVPLNESESLGAGTHATDAAQPLYVGWGSGGASGFFAGSIDNVRLYRSVLTASDVTSDMNTCLVPPGSPPTVTAVPSVAATQTSTFTIAAPATSTPTQPLVATSTNTANPTATQTPTVTTTLTGTATASATSTASKSPSATLTPTASPTPTSTPATSPVAAWAFDEASGLSAADASGNGNTVALTSPSRTTGQCAQALSYNGTTTLGTAGVGGSIANLSPLTVTLWVKRTGSGTLLYKSDNNGSAGWWLQFTGGTLEFTVVRSSQDYRVTAALPSANVWHHVVATWTGQLGVSGAAQLYLDGVLLSAAESLGSGSRTTDAAQPLYLGWGGGGSMGYFAGTIDNVRLYNRTLSPSDVATDMNTCIGLTS